jgi:phenylpropionate dioxygenase-like ring-hydroxylating dioxygenase large terminal subunit
VADAVEVTTRPRAVRVDGVPLVLLRLADGAPPVAYADRCPHRLVPLSAGQVVASRHLGRIGQPAIEGGALRCRYHGWEFGADGRCVALPSLGPDATPPPRADLLPGPEVRERDGVVYLRRDEVVARPDPDGLSNVDEALLYAWHPVALAAEVEDDKTHVTTLLGREWTLRRVDGSVQAEPAPEAVTERWGLVWLAPRPPLVELFDDPDEDDRYVGAWLPPATTPAPAGVVADNFLDVAHFPFVHAGTFGAGEEKVVSPYEVTDDEDGCRSVQVQWFDNPADPGVATGTRPVRQRRRATYVYRAPFQLMLRLEELDAGAVKTILFFAQPETLTSTRIYTKMLLYGIGGVERPGPDVVSREVAFEEAVLGEDLELQRHMTLTGLPLRPRDELHVRADRLGVALRKHLRAFKDRASGVPT